MLSWIIIKSPGQSADRPFGRQTRQNLVHGIPRLQQRDGVHLKGGVGDRPIPLSTKVALGMQAPLTFAIPKNQLNQILSQQARTH